MGLAVPEVERRPRLVAYVLTRNEEQHVGDVVRSLLLVTDRVLVIDSESEDATRKLAVDAGAEVVVHPFEGFSAQRNWAVAHLRERWGADWVLSLDADERLSAELVEEINHLALGANGHAAYLVPRVVRFEGRLLRFGGTARSRLLRLFRATSGHYEARAVNEHFALDGGAALGALDHPIIHEDVVCWERYIDKHNRYSTMEAEARVAAQRGDLSAMAALRRPDLRRRWVRERVWNKLPAKPAVYFLYAYVGRGGFLDGRAGLDRAVFGAWQELCSDLKWRELGDGVARAADGEG